MVKVDLKHYGSAIADHDTAVHLNPNDAYVYIVRGSAKVASGQHFAAITDYDSAIRLDPDNARAYYYRGLVKKKITGSGSWDFNKAKRLAREKGEWEIERAAMDAMYP